jgi:hypothetical protein
MLILKRKRGIYVSKDPSSKCAEWKGHIETIFKKASSIAFAETKGRKKKPDLERFKKKAISYTPQLVSEQQNLIVRHFGDFKRREFLDCFKLVRSHLEKGENEEDLEKIIQEWYAKIEKEWYAKIGKEKP